jgi:hypothetical protein
MKNLDESDLRNALIDIFSTWESRLVKKKALEVYDENTAKKRKTRNYVYSF